MAPNDAFFYDFHRHPVGGRVPPPFLISTDRKHLSLRATSPSLRGQSYRSLCARIEARHPSEIGPTELLDEVGTYFWLPLQRLRTRLREGRLTVTSAPGAKVRVLLARSGRRAAALSYRQPLRSASKRLPLRFTCRSHETYRVRIRARDRYGNRRTAKLRKQCD